MPQRKSVVFSLFPTLGKTLGSRAQVPLQAFRRPAIAIPEHCTSPSLTLPGQRAIFD